MIAIMHIYLQKKYKNNLKPFLNKRIKSKVVIYSISNMLLISLMPSGKKRPYILKQSSK